MRSVLFLFVIIAFLSGLWVPAYADSDLEVAKGIFEGNCARCHGISGAGDGLDARRMLPRPRKLSEGIFKFRTTASGTPPTDEDLYRTISRGLPGSRMPDFQRLPEETRMNLVAYVKSLSPVFQDQQPEPIDLGKDPGSKQADLAKGKALYGQLGCASCHGESGRANGPSAPTLVDNWGEPIRPADLTQGWNYRGGAAPGDIVARLMAGIDGTPMPSYADAVAKEDGWHLAYYVASMQEIPRWNRTVEAVKMNGALPAAPEEPRWKEVPRTDLLLSSNLYKGGEIQPTTVTAVSVQAVYNEEHVLFRLSWHDPTESRESPPDAAGLFLLQDRRLKFRLGSLRSWPAGADAPALDLCYWSARSAEAREAAAVGTADLESGQPPGELLESAASYNDGAWTLVIRRPLRSPLAGGANLSGDKPVLFGLAVGDGGNGEQGRRRSNSNWVDLVLK